MSRSSAWPPEFTGVAKQSTIMSSAFINAGFNEVNVFLFAGLNGWFTSIILETGQS